MRERGAMTVRGIVFAGALAAAVAAAACRSERPDARPPAAVEPGGAAARLDPTYDEHGVPVGLHNFRKWTDKLAQGAQPLGDAAFRNLAALGYRTIVTVDAARPDIETAERYGLRYVHVPIGYDGVPHDAQVSIVGAVRNSDGPVYVHCHHGTARGPAAVAVARVALDGVSNDEALAGLKGSGCSPSYKGLFRDVAQCVPPTAEELARVPARQPSYTPPSDLATAMVVADQRFDRLKLSRAAKWGVPPEHSDVDPPHEATMLWEQIREMARLSDARTKGEDFLQLLANSESGAKELEGALQRRDPSAADRAADAVRKSCDACHAKYRN